MGHAMKGGVTFMSAVGWIWKFVFPVPDDVPIGRGIIAVAGYGLVKMARYRLLDLRVRRRLRDLRQTLGVCLAP